MRKWLVAPLAGLMLLGCASLGTTYKTMTISGESLRGLGVQFETVARLYKTGCDSKTIKKEDCDTFREFGVVFKREYPVALDLWNASREAGDSQMEGATRERMVKLAEELTRLAAIAYATFGAQ